MKKVLFVFAALILIAALCTTAFADDITWAEIEPMITEAGWEGGFVTFDPIAVKIWIPSVLEEEDLTQEDIAEGYIGYFASEDGTAAMGVMYMDLDGMTLEEYADALTDFGAEEIETAVVNGVECVMYTLPEDDTFCIAYTTEAGYGFEVSFSPVSDEECLSVFSVIAASIQPE